MSAQPHAPLATSVELATAQSSGGLRLLGSGELPGCRHSEAVLCQQAGDWPWGAAWLRSSLREGPQCVACTVLSVRLCPTVLELEGSLCCAAASRT